MKGEDYADLGAEIEREYRRADLDVRAFAEIAREALMRWPAGAEFDLADICRFALSTSVEQMPTSLFSDLPVVLYRTREFFLQLLIWAKGTTDIHRHSFSGAFRVESGSSLLSEYAFEPQSDCGSRMKVGKLDLRAVQLLTRGDVRPILAGEHGLAHALFHLDQPSVTLVARTISEDWAKPQHSFHPAGGERAIALAAEELSKDAQILLTRRTVDVLGTLAPGRIVDHLCRVMSRLDPASAVVAYMSVEESLSSDEDRRLVLEAFNRRHGDTGCPLAEAAEERSRLRGIWQSRHSVTDPGLRFFLGVLLNVPSREGILGVVREHDPESDPVQSCARWLQALGDPGTLVRAVAKIRIAPQWTSAPSRFAMRLSAALHGIPEHGALEILSTFVRGPGEQEPPFDSADLRERARTALRSLIEIPELRALAQPWAERVS